MSKPEIKSVPHTFSLKWKLSAALSIALVLSEVFLTGLFYVSLDNQFQLNQQQTFDRSQAVLRELHLASIDRLINRAPTIAALAGGDNQTQPFDALKLEIAFMEHWETASLDMGLVSVGIYNGTGELAKRWDYGLDPAFFEVVQPVIAEALASERPQSVLACFGRCLQFAFVPQLDRNGDAYVVGLSSSMANLALEFSRASGTHLAILLDAEGDGTCCWGHNISVSSDRSLANELLGAASNAGFSLEDIASGLALQHNGRTYQIDALQSGDIGKHAFELVIADVTESLETIDSSIRELVVTGVAVILVTLSVLLKLLWGPTSAIRALALAMPLLSERRYAALREDIAERRKRRVESALPDEIDLLEDAVTSVSEKLESLELDLSRRANALQQRATELEDERDFTSLILNTAPTVMLTLDSKLAVAKINNFGARIMGQQAESILGKDFIDLIQEGEGDNVEVALMHLFGSNTKDYRHESKVHNQMMGERDISWVHTRITGETVQLLSVGIDISEQRQAAARLKWSMDHDRITTLYTESRFISLLDGELALANDGDTMSVVLLSIDNFKDLTFSLGRQVVDQCLYSVGQALLETPYYQSSAPSWAARIGGNEFAVALPKVGRAEVLEYVDAVNLCISKSEIDLEGHPLTFSSGVAIYPKHGKTAQDLLAHADIAANTVRTKGGDGCQIYSDKDVSRNLVERRVLWRQRIKEALGNDDGFVLMYQPIVRLSDMTISHSEVLLRMKGADGALISPALFIDVAESSNQVAAIEKWVIDKSVAKLAELSEQGNQSILSVNLSGRSIDSPGLLSTIQTAINKHGVDPKRLVFELTETAAVAHIDRARQVIEQVRALGCSFAFDDFGTGQSSFEYLKTLPADYIKLDASYIKRVHRSKADQTFVLAMTNLAHDLGKQVIAEGVEEKACYEWLNANGVDYIQGYYFGKPALEVLDKIDQADGV